MRLAWSIVYKVQAHWSCCDVVWCTDVWSAGCVLAELLLGQPVFPGATAGDQLVEIIKILGTPSSEDFSEINRNYQNVQFPYLRPTSWDKVRSVIE